MPQAISPNRLQPDTPLKDNIAYINDNFDKVVSAVNDIGVNFTGNTVTGALTVGAGARQWVTIHVKNTAIPGTSSSQYNYIPGTVQAIPRLKMFIDTNNDDSYILPFGSSLTTEQVNCDISCFPLNGYVASTDEFATWMFCISNRGISSHDYYVVLNTGLIQSPVQGLFR